MLKNTGCHGKKYFKIHLLLEQNPHRLKKVFEKKYRQNMTP